MNINHIWICIILTFFGASMSHLTSNLSSCTKFLQKNNQIMETKKNEIYFRINLCSFIYAFIVIFFVLLFKREMQPVYTILDLYKCSFVFVAPVSFMVILMSYALYYVESISGKVNIVSNSEYKLRKVVLSVFEVLLVTSFFGTLLIK